MQCWRDPALHASFFFPRGTPQTTRATRHALTHVAPRPRRGWQAECPLHDNSTKDSPAKARSDDMSACHDKRDQVRVRELLHGTTWPVVETRQTEERRPRPRP
jgi:hypothetical protein